jgi:hypothetical protein
LRAIQPSPIFRVDHRLIVTWYVKLLQGATEIIERASVSVKPTSIGPADHDELRNIVDEVPKLFLCPFQVLDIYIGSVPSDHLAIIVSKWFGAKQKPTIFSIRSSQAGFLLSWFV